MCCASAFSPDARGRGFGAVGFSSGLPTAPSRFLAVVATSFDRKVDASQDGEGNRNSCSPF